MEADLVGGEGKEAVGATEVAANEPSLRGETEVIEGVERLLDF